VGSGESIVSRFLRSKGNNWSWLGLVDCRKALCGCGLRRRRWCRRPAQTEPFPAPSLADHRPGRSGIGISRCCDTSCEADRALDSSWCSVYIRSVLYSRKVFSSLRLRQCSPLFLDFGETNGNNSTARIRSWSLWIVAVSLRRDEATVRWASAPVAKFETARTRRARRPIVPLMHKLSGVVAWSIRLSKSGGVRRERYVY